MTALFAACTILNGGFSQAQDAAKPEEPKAETPKPAAVVTPSQTPGGSRVTTILDSLDNPSGVAIQPETGIVFVSDSGAGRIVKVVDGKAEPVVTDFKTDIYGKGPMFNIGPLGLLFLDKNTLVVGGGDLPDGEEQLRVFDLTEMKEALKVDAAKASFKLPADGDIKGEGNFYALAAVGGGIYITANGDDTKGWIAKATYEGKEVKQLERFLATKELVEVDAPVAITVSSKNQLVVGQMGEINVPNDSLLTFYDPKTKEKLLNLKTQLHDITALAYSKRGQLYALDFAWLDTTKGGLFQLLKDGDGMKTKMILPLDKPTAMAFADDGSLYITLIGSEAKKGQLIKVEPGL